VVSTVLLTLGQDGLLPAAEIDSDSMIAHGLGVHVDDYVVYLADLELEIKAKNQAQSQRSQQPGSKYDELFESALIPLNYHLPAEVDSGAPADSESADKLKS
jgi:hypothetical protein